mgnify:FL=1
MKIAQYGPNLNKAANRYKDRYFNGEYVKKNGDALQETHTWYGASGVFFKGTDSGASQGALVRATNNSIFDYNASRFDYGWGSRRSICYYTIPFSCSRSLRKRFIKFTLGDCDEKNKVKQEIYKEK